MTICSFIIVRNTRRFLHYLSVYSIQKSLIELNIAKDWYSLYVEVFLPKAYVITYSM